MAESRNTLDVQKETVDLTGFASDLLGKYLHSEQQKREHEQTLAMIKEGYVPSEEQNQTDSNNTSKQTNNKVMDQNFIIGLGVIGLIIAGAVYFT